MGDQLRVEQTEVGGEFLVMSHQELHALAQIQWPPQSLAGPHQGNADSLGLSIGTQPAPLPNLRETRISSGGQSMTKAFDAGVKTGHKLVQRNIGIGRPIACQEMIVKHINQNRTEPSQGSINSAFANSKHRMSVGKCVDDPVLTNPWNEFVRDGHQFPRLQQIRQQVTDAGGWRRIRKVQMSEPVQGRCVLFVEGMRWEDSVGQAAGRPPEFEGAIVAIGCACVLGVVDVTPPSIGKTPWPVQRGL